MAGTKLRDMRLPKEIEMLTKTPPHGITCWTLNDSLDRLEAGTSILKQFFSKQLMVCLTFCNSRPGNKWYSIRRR